MNLDVPFDRKNVKVKAYFVPYNTDQGSPTNYSDLFHNITSNNILDQTACGTAPGTSAGSGVKASNDTFHGLIVPKNSADVDLLNPLGSCAL